ncbi:MAG: HD domain-containing protein [Candidatus Moraniibacteriota bacterium]
MIKLGLNMGSRTGFKSKLGFHIRHMIYCIPFRVMSIARTIAKAEKVDQDIVIPAALFHDVANYPKNHPKIYFSSDLAYMKAAHIPREHHLPKP